MGAPNLRQITTALHCEVIRYFPSAFATVPAGATSHCWLCQFSGSFRDAFLKRAA